MAKHKAAVYHTCDICQKKIVTNWFKHGRFITVREYLVCDDQSINSFFNKIDICDSCLNRLKSMIREEKYN